MFGAVKAAYENCDCLIMAAAVSDYTIAKKSKVKIKKSDTPLRLDLKPTKDILKWAGKNKKNQFLVGFALEDREIRKQAEQKLNKKKLDMIIANRPAAISAERSSVEIKVVNRDWLKIQNASKTVIANKIVKLIAANQQTNQ